MEVIRSCKFTFSWVILPTATEETSIKSSKFPFFTRKTFVVQSHGSHLFM